MLAVYSLVCITVPLVELTSSDSGACGDEGGEAEEGQANVPAKLFDTRTFLPSFCPSSTPTTRFRVPFACRP
jgi:hypothetical protein